MEEKYAKKSCSNFSSGDDKRHDMLPEVFNHPKYDDLADSTEDSQSKQMNQAEGMKEQEGQDLEELEEENSVQNVDDSFPFVGVLEHF